MSATTVLLTNEPSSRRQSLRWSLSGKPELEMVELTEEPERHLRADLGDLGWHRSTPRALEILHAVGRSHADVVVISRIDEPAEAALCSHLLQEYPDLVVIAVPATGREIVVRHRRAVRWALSGEIDRTVLDAIRRCCENDAESPR